ncbi:HDIG domain-containing metalloprotein [Phocaeicola vulgatus]|uniref:HD family phosphohydrolase n=1 Tax=Phocaeicola vulgatus TaxID=821 RepID=UPI002306EA5D|nr:HDIG domain-containing protein [Phocaeicola vulgatus]MDB0934109.1 HDIG domain-containing protein [Phocaeicola vulgatus]MDB0938771.1 HDIG domain-containing protein [Phocaeicola vulgatus]
MRSFKTNQRFSYKNLIYKSLIFIATVSVIVYFLPNEGKFNYQFDINKPWKYGLLQASFDFPIYKNDIQVQKEQDSILADYQPYFQIDKEAEKNVLSKLREDYNKTLRHSLPGTDYVRYIERTLKALYEDGIIAGNDLKRMEEDSIIAIRLVDKNVATSRFIDQLYTVKEAYEYLLNADTTHYKKKILQQCNLNDYITPNLVYDEEKSEAAQKDLLSNISWANGFVLNGQKIIDRGEIVDEQTYNILESLRKEWEKRSDSVQEKRLTLAGQILYVGIFLFCFMAYLELFRADYYERKGTLTLLFALIVFFPVLSSIMMEQNLSSIYVVPFAMIPIIVRVFLDSRTAFMAHVTIILLCSITLRFPHEFILLQVVAGMVAIYSLRELSQRSQLLRTALVVFISYALLYFAFELIHEDDLTKLNTRMYIYFMINGILLLFAYPLLFLLEKIFGFTSDVTLVELSNINNSLLREMSEVAPGTFQHSLQMANLAAAAANKIGGKSQLVRTGALYHDIGKMVNPAFFTENQSGVNPHKSLSYEQSAQVIISHITDGLKLAEKHNLPKVIKDFISTHHGRGLTKYFYISYKNEHPDEEVDQEKFRYPGPNPFTKEQAVLMMADSVEAASRSLPEYTEESISTLVDKIIDTQVSEGYFKECPITFKDIATVKALFKEKLKTMYHTRISYPELRK